VHLLDPRSDAQGVVARITQVGLLLQKEQDGQSLAARFQRDLAHQHSQAVWATPPRGVFILAGGGRPTVVAGGDTHPGALLRMAGTVNLGDALTGFKSLSQEFLASAQPEFILTNPDGLQGTPPVVLAAPGARLTAAARQGRVIALPGYLLQGMGIHTPRAIAQLREALKPWFA
jgi:iron complex transport system substrate-binding protein